VSGIDPAGKGPGRSRHQGGCLHRIDAPVYWPPAVAGDAMYLATEKRLYLIAEQC